MIERIIVGMTINTYTVIVLVTLAQSNIYIQQMFIYGQNW